MATQVRSEKHILEDRLNLAMMITVLVAVAISGINPYDRLTWLLEVSPVVIGVGILAWTYRFFRFTRLSYLAIFFACLFICIGGTYTYERVPIGLWAKEAWGLSRNHWDRLGHFMQGVFTALLMREIVLRRSGLKRTHWLFMLVCASSLAIATLFEFVEWGVAVFIGDGSQAYLATQGDEWDAHWDMFLAFIGSILTQLVFARMQDRELTRRGLALGK